MYESFLLCFGTFSESQVFGGPHSYKAKLAFLLLICLMSIVTSAKRTSKSRGKISSSEFYFYTFSFWFYKFWLYDIQFSAVQFSSFAQSCPTLCDPMNHSTPGLPVLHQLPESTQTHDRRVGDAIQPSHPLSSPSPPAPSPSQHQGLFQWINSSHEVAKVLEFQLQHHSFQRTPRTDLL